jgi:ABC-type branched-subunit amino acid transport system ATPase component
MALSQRIVVLSFGERIAEGDAGGHRESSQSVEASWAKSMSALLRA